MILFKNVTATDKPEFESLIDVFYQICPEQELFDADSNCLFIHDDDHVEWRRSLPYKEYLHTHYWYLVSKVKKSLEPVCQICREEKRLNVHHKTYENKGNELLHLNDLIVLCKKCHEKFHEIGDKNVKK